MFVLTALEDDICVLPVHLTKPPLEAVTDVIQERFVDKVIPDVGLVVTIYDVESIEGGTVYPNDGAAYFKVTFRLVVFRPFVGEVLVGKLKSCNKDGLRISLGFFDDIHVPDHAMQEPSFYSEAEKLWNWKYDPATDMWMDTGEDVRVRVQAVRFNPTPTPGQLAEAVGDDRLLGTAARPFSPLEVVATINSDGLGCLTWWTQEEAGE